MNVAFAIGTPVIFGAVIQYIVGPIMFLTALFLILLILVQRGRGGGLAGAFGGMGGQSAFGTKAGDTFTRVTMIMAAFWILLSIACIKLINKSVEPKPVQPSGISAPDADKDKDKDADDTTTPGGIKGLDGTTDKGNSGDGDTNGTGDDADASGKDEGE